MSKMYHLTNQEQLPRIQKEGIQIDSKDLMPRTYLADDWQWIRKLAEIFRSLNESLPEEDLAVIELDVDGIQVFPDDMPADLLPEHWEQTAKEEYSKHCFFTTENIPFSRIRGIYELNGKPLILKMN